MQVIDNLELDNICNEAILKVPAHLKELRFYYKLMYLTGCRAEESVNFNMWSFVSENIVMLKPLKNNNNRIFDVTELPQEFTSFVNGEYATTLGFNYRKLQYYIDSSIGYYGLTVGNKKIKCHVFRHNFAKRLFDSGLAEEAIQMLMGHTSMESTQGYIYSIIEAKYL